MRISTLTYIAFEINGAIDSGKYTKFSVSNIKEQIYKKTIFSFLENSIKELDLSLIQEDERLEIIKEWEDMAIAINESKKLLVDNNGLCLIVAYLLEGIQRRIKIQTT